MTSHYGDGQLDIFDWLPLLVIVFGGVLLFSSLIPSTVLGRDARKDEDILDSTISQLENGILVLSAIKEGGSCSAKLACSLGAATRTSFKNKDGIISLVDAFLPHRYAGFTSAFNRAARAEEGADHQACTGSCHRCIQF